MKHKIKKTKIRFGKDANTMLLRKLSVNFLKHGHLTTTKAKAKELKSFLDSLLNKVKEDSEVNKRIVFQVLQNKDTTKNLFTQMSDDAKKIQGSYLSIKPEKIRTSDGAPMVKVQWAHEFFKPVVEEKPKAEKKAAKPKAEKKEKSS